MYVHWMRYTQIRKYLTKMKSVCLKIENVYVYDLNRPPFSVKLYFFVRRRLRLNSASGVYVTLTHESQVRITTSKDNNT